MGLSSAPAVPSSRAPLRRPRRTRGRTGLPGVRTWMALLGFWVTLAAGLLSSTNAAAQSFTGTRALSLGGAYRAIATGNDAIYFNPAGIAQIPRYSGELHYNLSELHEGSAHQGDISVVDSKTSQFAAGLAYTLQGSEFIRRNTLKNEATLALAYPVLPHLLSFGLGFKYVNLTDAVAGNYLNALSADLGVLATLPGGVSLAAVGYNLIPIQSSAVPISAAFAVAWDLGPASAALFGGGTPRVGPRMDASGSIAPPEPLGLSGYLDGLTLSLDWYINFFSLYGPQNRIAVGIEYLIADLVPVRAGYTFDQEDQDHLVSVGTGFVVPYFGLDLAYRHSVRDWDQVGTFAMSLKFFLDLPGMQGALGGPPPMP